MRTDFESTQIVEVVTKNDGHEAEFIIGLECTAASYPGYFDPRVGGEPPSGPEFEPTTIQVLVPRVNRRPDQPEFEASLELTWAQFAALVGGEIADELFERACIEADETGGF